MVRRKIELSHVYGFRLLTVAKYHRISRCGLLYEYRNSVVGHFLGKVDVAWFYQPSSAAELIVTPPSRQLQALEAARPGSFCEDPEPLPVPL